MLEKRTDDTVNFDAPHSPKLETEIDPEKAQTKPDIPQLIREQRHVSHHELHCAASCHIEDNAAQYEPQKGDNHVCALHMWFLGSHLLDHHSGSYSGSSSRI